MRPAALGARRHRRCRRPPHPHLGEASRAGVGRWPEPKDRWVLYQDAVLPHHFKAGPRLRGVSHRITARIERQSTDQDGAIIAAGGRFGGWSVFIHGNRLCYTTNNFGER